MKCIKCIKCKWKKENQEYDYCQKCYDNIYSKDVRDYQDMVNKDTPKEIRKKFNIWDIRSNSIKCNECWDTPRSKNRHNMQYCKCWACAVDWWSWYWRIIWYERCDDNSEKFNDI